jgi:prohibitin 2
MAQVPKIPLNGVGGVVGAAVVGLGSLMWLSKKALFTVDGGYRAVVFSRLFGVKDATYDEGTHLIIPYVDEPHIFSVRVKPTRRAAQTGSKDLQMVKVNLYVFRKKFLEKKKLTIIQM